MVTRRFAAAIIIAVPCIYACAVNAEKCPPSDVQYDGLYVCWDTDAIAAFEDLSTTDNPPTNRTYPQRSGPDAGTWWYIRLERGLHADGWNFEGGTGTFTTAMSGDPDDVTTASLDRGNITYVIGAFSSSTLAI